MDPLTAETLKRVAAEAKKRGRALLVMTTDGSSDVGIMTVEAAEAGHDQLLQVPRAAALQLYADLGAALGVREGDKVFHGHVSA